MFLLIIHWVAVVSVHVVAFAVVAAVVAVVFVVHAVYCAILLNMIFVIL